MMKKTLLSVLFVLLLIQGNAFAEILDLGNGLKINLPNNFSYLQETFEEADNVNSFEMTQEELEASRKSDKELGFKLSDKITSMAPGLDLYTPEYEVLKKTGDFSDEAKKEMMKIVKKCQRKSVLA